MHEITNNIQLSVTALNLRRLRIERGYSLAAVSQQSKVKLENIFDYENDRKTPKMRDIKKLAAFYGVKVDEIFCAIADD